MRDLSTPLWLGIAATTVSSHVAATQRVTGVVRDSASRETVSSAVVRLFDTSGRELSRTITARDGRYRLNASPAARELRVVRIGFRPRATRLASGVSRDTTIDIVLAALPTMLEAIDVQDQPQCSRRSDRAAALAVWEQARAALLATIVSRELQPPSLTAISYDRTLDRRGRVVRQTVHHDSLPNNRPFIAARTIDEFRTAGYADGTTSQRIYYAPDADILLDQSFGDGHCFSLRDDQRRHPGQIGLVFEPARDRDGIIDVSGAMWLDVATPALRTVEFRYTNVEPAVASADAGGLLSFRTASNALSLIDYWSLHLPSLVQAADTRSVAATKVGTVAPGLGKIFFRPADAARWRVAEVHDVGAVIAAAQWPDGSEWHSPLGALRGRAVRPDSSAVPGLLVWLTGSDDSTRTRDDGSFELTQLLPGPYPVFAAETPADRYEFLQIDSLRIEVDTGASPPLRLVVPTLDERVRSYCKGSSSGPTNLLVLGTVLLPNGSKAAGASIDGFWGEGSDANHLKARTDTSGAFHVCGLRAAQRVRISVALDSLDATAKDSIAPRLDSVLTRWTVRLSVPRFRSRNLVVIDDQSGAPISGALVADDDSELHGMTNARGEVSLGWLQRGRSTLLVQRRGYALATVKVVIDPGEVTDVSVALRRIP